MGNKKKGGKRGVLSDPSPIVESLPSDVHLLPENQFEAILTIDLEDFISAKGGVRVKITEAPGDGQHAQPGAAVAAAEQLQHEAHDLGATGVADQGAVRVSVAEGCGGDSVSLEVTPQADRKHWLGAEPKTPPPKIWLGESMISPCSSTEGTSPPREGEGQAFSPGQVADTVSNGIDWGKGIIENGISGLVGAGASIVGGIQKSMSPEGSGSSHSARLVQGEGDVPRVRRRGSSGMEGGGQQEQPSTEEESMIPGNMIVSNAMIGTPTGAPSGISTPLQGGGGAAGFPAVGDNNSVIESAAGAPGSALDELQHGGGAGTSCEEVMDIGRVGAGEQREEGWQVHAADASKTAAGGKNGGGGGGWIARVNLEGDSECPRSLGDAGRSVSLPVQQVDAAGSAEAATFALDASKPHDEGKVRSEATDGGGPLLARIGEEKDEDCVPSQMRERQLSWPSMDRQMWRQMDLKSRCAVRKWEKQHDDLNESIDSLTGSFEREPGDKWTPEVFVESQWQQGGVCMHPSVFPCAGLVPASATLSRSGSRDSKDSSGALSKTSSYDSLGSSGGGGVTVKLATSLSKVVVEQGPRALQQDAGVIEAVGGGVPVICVCDGHGSVAMLQMDQGKTPREVRNMVHVGGTQCAEISCKAIIEYFKEKSAEFDLRSADVFMHSAFVSAHRAVLEHLRKGSYEGDAEDDSKASSMDGSYWKNQNRLVVNLGANRKHMVIRKVTKGTTTYYQRASGAWMHADFGTTCTCCAILNAPDEENQNRKVIVTAHAGDSDVCLLRFSQPQHSGQTPVLLWGKWLTKEHTMYSEEERERESAQGMKVKEREGAGNLAHKIKVSITLPNGETGAVAYEPTRGLGHCEGQFAGIIPVPSVSCAELQQNDIVIIGTDGLWNALGGRRQNGDTGPPSEDIAGPLMATLRNFCAKHRQQDAQQLAVELTGVARARGLVDNTLFAVAKVNKIAVGGGRQGAAAAVKDTPQIGSGMLEFLMKPF